MIDLKKIYTEVFSAIKSDPQLLDLLEIDHSSDDPNEVIKNIREQVIDTPKPDDLLTNYKTRVCIYEDTNSRNSLTDKGVLRIDIHMTQDKNAIDRRLPVTAKRLIEIIDSKERTRLGLRPLAIGLDGLTLKSRRTSSTQGSTGWDIYKTVFEYRFIV